MKLMIDPEWETVYWELTPGEVKVFEDDRSELDFRLRYHGPIREKPAELRKLEAEAFKLYRNADPAVRSWRDASRWAGSTIFGIPVRVVQ